MKKLYALTLAASCLLSAAAAQPETVTNFKTPEGHQALRSQLVSNPKARAQFRTDAKTQASRHKAPGRRQVVAGPSASDKFISETPAGTLTIVEKSGSAFAQIWGMVFKTTIDGSVSKIVRDGDKIYMYGVFSQYLVNGWMEGTVKDDVATFQLPQFVSHEEFYGVYYDDYALKLEYVQEEDGGWYYPAEDQTYKLKINADGSYTSLEEDYCLGMCYWDEENECWEWEGCGDILETMVPFTKEVPALPATAKFDDWYMVNTDGTASVMSISIDGSKVYFKNPYQVAADDELYNSYIEGTLADGSITVKSGQFLGLDWTTASTLYYTGESATEVYDEENDEYVTEYEYLDELTMKYDADKKIITCDGAMSIGYDPKCEAGSFVTYLRPTFKYQAPDTKIESVDNPVILTFNAPEGYDAEFWFTLSQINAQDQIIDASKLYYSIYLDGELFTFYSDEYPGLPGDAAEATEIPYGYNNVYEFYGYGARHCVVIYPEGMETLGVQLIYKDGEKELKSDIVTCDAAGIRSTVANGQLQSETYYDLQGRRVTNPAAGLYIRRAVYADGTIETTKLCKR